MLIKSWLSKVIAAHQARCPRDDWPEPDSREGKRLWSQWFDGMKEHRVEHREAELASRRINGEGLEWVEDHLPTLLATVRQMREEPEPATIPMAPADVGSLDPDGRRVEAVRLLDEFYSLGWCLEWVEAEGRFRCRRSEPDVPRPSREFSERFRSLRDEVHALMGHPIADEPILDMDDFRDEGGRFQWRRMVAALAGELQRAP
jgi:hypothetical protein